MATTLKKHLTLEQKSEQKSEQQRPVFESSLFKKQTEWLERVRKINSKPGVITLKLQLHSAIYRLRFYSNSLTLILPLSNSHNNVASTKKNRGDKSHHVIVALVSIFLGLQRLRRPRFGYSNVVFCLFLVTNIESCHLSIISKKCLISRFCGIFDMRSNYFGPLIPKKLKKF